MMTLQLPAATSEDIDVPLLSWDMADPTAVTWQAAVSASATVWPGPAPSTFAAATIVNRGTTESPDYRIRVRVAGLSAGTYGVWVKVNAGVGTSPVRFAGQLILY